MILSIVSIFCRLTIPSKYQLPHNYATCLFDKKKCFVVFTSFYVSGYYAILQASSQVSFSGAPDIECGLFVFSINQNAQLSNPAFWLVSLIGQTFGKSVLLKNLHGLGLKIRNLHTKFINSTTKLVNYKHSIPNSEKLGDLKLSHSCNPKVLFYRVTHQLTVLESCVSKNEFIEA